MPTNSPIHGHAHDDGAVSIYADGKLALEIPGDPWLLTILAALLLEAAAKASRQSLKQGE